MPTTAQLSAESWAYDAEIRPPTLVALGEGVREHYGLSYNAIGIKGDAGHLSGGHRSPRWIINSAYSRSGWSDGSLTTSTGGKISGANDDLRALDVTPGSAQRMKNMTIWLYDAMMAGKIPQVRRFCGTRDGVTTWGWDSYYDLRLQWDDSHLWHVHVEMYPDRVREGHAAVLAAMTGGDDVSLTVEQDSLLRAMAYRVDAFTYGADDARGGPYVGEDVWLVRHLKAMQQAQAASAQREADLAAALAALASGGTSIDTTAVLARIDERANDVTGAVAALQAELDEEKARSRALRIALAEAGASLGAADDGDEESTP